MYWYFYEGGGAGLGVVPTISLVVFAPPYLYHYNDVKNRRLKYSVFLNVFLYIHVLMFYELYVVIILVFKSFYLWFI